VRVSEDRYSQDLRRLNLAQWLIQLEVRSQWICAWTGFSKVRVRHLYHAYHRAQGRVRRPRGPSPTRMSAFLRSPILRAEASAIGGLARVLGVIPMPEAAAGRLDRLGVEGAERLCRLFEFYRRVAPHSRFSMDQLIRLVIALTQGEEFEIGHCRGCHGALLIDRLGGDTRRTCPACREDSLTRGADPPCGVPATSELAPSAIPDSPESYQQSLF
jgi:hypothetical protein